MLWNLYCNRRRETTRAASIRCFKSQSNSVGAQLPSSLPKSTVVGQDPVKENTCGRHCAVLWQMQSVHRAKS